MVAVRKTEGRSFVTRVNFGLSLNLAINDVDVLGFSGILRGEIVSCPCLYLFGCEGCSSSVARTSSRSETLT